MAESGRKVVVIGSGIGGSAIGSLLSSRGFDVTVLEKHKLIGGRCCSREREGFILDLGVHTFSQSGAGPLGEVLRQSGRSDDVIKWTYTKNPTQKLNYLGRTIEYPKGISDIGANVTEYGNIISAIMKMSAEEMKSLDHTPLKEWLGTFTRNQVIYNILAYICELYFIVTPEKASTGEFIRSMKEQALKRASGYPEGGCRVIPQSYLDVITANGGSIRTKAAVKRIIIENNEAKGVELDSGEVIQADIVISNADPGITVLDLAGEGNFPAEFVSGVKKLEYTPGAFLLKFALKEKITDEKFIMFIGASDADEYLRKIENNEVPDKVNLMIPVISNLDPTTAPEGKQLIVAGTFPVKKPDWKAWEKATMDSVKMVFPDIEKHAQFIESTTAQEIDGLLGEGGSVIGLSQNVDQIGRKRVSQKSPVGNLYFVGSEAGGWGIGTELAATSALELNKMIR